MLLSVSCLMSQPISSQCGDHVTSEDQSERSTGCYDDLVSSHLCHCHCHHNHHPSHLSRVGGHLQTFLFLDGCLSYSSKHNQPSPTSQQAKQISSLRVSDRWRFQSQGPKDDISEMCGVCGCTFVCVCPAGHAGVQITLQNTTVLWAQIKRQSRLMCWSSGVSVAVAWSALFCLK